MFYEVKPTWASSRRDAERILNDLPAETTHLQVDLGNVARPLPRFALELRKLLPDEIGLSIVNVSKRFEELVEDAMRRGI